MKLCDMCSPRTSEADRYELRFDRLPTEDCDVPEHLVSWRGELCRRHASGVQAVLKAGPPTESADEASRPTIDAAFLEQLAARFRQGLPSLPTPNGLEWQDTVAIRLDYIASKIRSEP